MLSAFRPTPILELRARDKSKIESILAYGDRLLVGLNTGVLRVYRVNEPDPDNANTEGNDAGEPEQPEPANASPKKGHKKASASVSSTAERPSSSSRPKLTELLREQEKFSRYKIEQLAIIKEANILVSLSNTYVSLYDLQTYDLQEQLAKTKGASAFAVTSNIVKDPSTGVPSIVSRLAVAIKRRLVLWSWHDMEFVAEATELALVSGIRSLTWVAATKLVAGLSSTYVLVDVETQTVTDIAGPGSIGGAPGQESSRFGGVGMAGMSYMGMGGMIPKPLATRLGEGEVLLAKDINTHFMDTEGNPLGRRQIPWNTAPEAVGYSYPYLLALSSAGNGTLEVRNPQTLSLLQSISLPSATLLLVPQPNISLAHAGKGFLVASERSIWRMAALDYDSQIDALVEQKYLDEAILLLGMLEDALLKDKEGRLREIRMQKAKALFDGRRYRDALDLFTEVSAPPERVIKLYPELIAGDLAEKQNVESVPVVVEQEVSTPEAEGTPEPNGEPSKDSGTPISSPKRTPKSKTTGDTTDAQSLQEKASETQEGSLVLEGKDLRSAVLELRSFLADVRRKLQRYLKNDGTLRKEGFEPPAPDSPQGQEYQDTQHQLGLTDLNTDPDRRDQLLAVARLVDTTLFRAHMLVTPSLAGSLFRISNFCDPDVVKTYLEESGRYNDLVDFLYGKKMHRPALELLRKFGQTEPQAASEKTQEDSETTEPEPKSESMDPQLLGPKRTIAYLQNLPPNNIDLILEFADWPLRVEPEMAIEIFLGDTENAETLPRQKVLQFLEERDQGLAIRYLEHVVDELSDLSPDLHQKLLVLYLERLKGSMGKDEVGDGPSGEAKERLKGKFEDLLRSSEQYSPLRMLERLGRDDPEFYEARAIVLSKMGQHKQALEIYVFKLQDPEKAEEYCNRVHLLSTQESATSSDANARRPSAYSTALPYASTTDTTVAPSIYHTLLSLYLTPPPQYDSSPQFGPALSLLTRHGSRLPASSTLNLIPETLPVKELEFYFRGRIRTATRIVNEGRVVAGLGRVEAVEAEKSLLLGDDGAGVGKQGRNRRFEVSEVRVCGVCHKRLGGSVISVFPDNTVVHLGCASRK